MCGIGGILRTDGQPIPEEWLDAIDARIAYRGPDGHGRFRDRVEISDANAPGGKRVVEVAFVHRRLSIIDHKDGVQPMVSERGRNDKEGLVAVVFNGCIYNHRELRKELEAKGHRFVTDHSDTEVLIHGWREWQEELAPRIEGMYAIAIWDRSRGTVYMARDAFGEKPLFYPSVPRQTDDPEVFAFASAIDPIIRIWQGLHAVYQPQNSWGLVTNYLRFGYPDGLAVSTDNTLVFDHPVGRGFAIPPSNSKGESDSRPQPNVKAEAGVFSDRIEALLAAAVAMRLEADVPLGCFLSGGVDSSLVAFFASKQKSDLMTFCVRMPDARYDESAYAEAVARHIDAKHLTLEPAIDPAGDLCNLIKTLGQPFGDSSILPTYWVSKAARQHAKVALSGDGGDELFIGYERYAAAPSLAKHWPCLRRIPNNLLLRAHPKSRTHKFGRLIEMARDYSSLGLAAMEATFSRAEIQELSGAEVPQSLRCNAGADARNSLRRFDIDHYLPGDLLRKVDTASMACGLEVRCPFLDRDLARAALAAPIEQLMPGGQRKGLLRQIARKYLPKEIVDRPKMGFAIPIGEWFRSDYGGMKTLLLDHLHSAEPFGPIQLNRKAVQRFIDEHMSEKRDHGQRLFTLLTLSIWARQVAK